MSNKKSDNPSEYRNNNLLSEAEGRDWQAFIVKIGQSLAAERRRAGWSQQTVAEKIGLEPESVSRIENGAIAPTLARLRQFARIYGCSMESLIGNASDQSPDIAKRISAELDELSESDRAFVAEQTMNLIGHIKFSRQRK